MGVLTLDALGVDVVGVLDEVAFDAPGARRPRRWRRRAGAGPALDPLTAPFVPAGPRTEGLADDQDYERAVRVLADSAAMWGLLSDRGRARVTAEPRPRAGARVPRSLEDLAADQRNVGDGERYAGHVRVIEVPQAHGSAWVVEISGTQVWDPAAAQQPLRRDHGRPRRWPRTRPSLADGVHQALEQAQAASRQSEGNGPRRDRAR